LSGKKQQLDELITGAEGAAQVASEQRAMFDDKLITKIKQLTRSKAFREGDVEVLLNSKNAQQVSDAIEEVRLKLNDPEMSAGDAIDYISSLPNKSELKVKRDPNVKTLKKEIAELENKTIIKRDDEGIITSATAERKAPTIDQILKDKEKQFNLEQKEINKQEFEGYKTPAQKLNQEKQKIAAALREGSSDGLPEVVPNSNVRNGVTGKIKDTTDYFLKTGKAKLESLGGNGKEAAKRLEQFRMDHNIEAGTDIDSYNKTIKNMGDDSIERINRYLDGQKVELNTQEKEAALSIRAQLNKVLDKAKQVGIQTKDTQTGERSLIGRMENYLPHSIDVDKLSKEMQDTKSFVEKMALGKVEFHCGITNN